MGRTKKETGQERGSSSTKLRKFLKIITLHNRNSKNSIKNLIFSLRTVLALFKACVLYLLEQIYLYLLAMGHMTSYVLSVGVIIFLVLMYYI